MASGGNSNIRSLNDPESRPLLARIGGFSGQSARDEKFTETVQNVFCPSLHRRMFLVHVSVL